MSRERTIENILAEKPLYVDNLNWSFYEGGINTQAVKHDVELIITKMPEDKILAIMLTFKVQTPDSTRQIELRLSPYEFDKLNALFKRASFRLEKV